MTLLSKIPHFSDKYPLKILYLVGLLLISVTSIFIYSKSIESPKEIITGQAVLLGDCNTDNKVDIFDFQLLSNSFGKSTGQTGYNGSCDFNNSNSIDILDFQILSNNFGRTASSSNTPTARPTNQPTIIPSGQATPTRPPSVTSNPTGRFKVSNGIILDPNGRQFIVKGVTAAYGAFGGGDVNNYGTNSYDGSSHTYAGDMAEIARLGVNLVRIMASVPGTSYYSSNYATYYGSETNYKAGIDKIVKLVRANGMIAFVIPHHPTYSQSTVDFVRYLADTYKNDPYVWVGTSNEPDTCATTACWQNWQTWHDQYVRAIRSTGNQNPIIVNGIYWSGRMNQVQNYPLHDNNGNVDTNLIYGPHKYGNDNATFWGSDMQEVETNRMGMAENSPYAWIVDEFGNDNGGKGQISWLREFTDYVYEWTTGIKQHGSYTHSTGGDGAIAFTWRWSDGNKLVNSQGFTRTEWGNIFVSQYLQKVQ